MIYGALPEDLGMIDLSPTEMLFWMYCPIKAPKHADWRLPDNLMQFEDIVSAVYLTHEPFEEWCNSYVYLTAKTLWVSGDYIGNRPGWHSDGFGTDDINYIWCDRAPTEFVQGEFNLSTDCDESMREMEAIGWLHEATDTLVTFPDKHLLRLDQSVIHRSPASFEPGMRTFVKVSISKDRYDLVGNSINHDLPASHWPLIERQVTRNHPQSRLA